MKFTVVKKAKNSRARVGVMETAHGDVETPVFMPVGTQATVKSLTPQDLEGLGAQIILGNTYHLYLRPGADEIQQLGGLHKFMGWDKPLLTDSGGFQVFSLGLGKITKENRKRSRDVQAESLCEIEEAGTGAMEKMLCRVDEDGVNFRSHLDGTLHRFTPEVSIEIQRKLGADIILAFDECAPYPATYDYTKAALERTHRWAERSLETFNQKGTRHEQQALFGIVQGGLFKDLREESAKFISALPFDGIAVGGVSVGEPKEKMHKVVEWVVPFLDQSKPRHLLGVGEIDDLLLSIERGMDMFDCVAPTRLARNGALYVSPYEGGNQKNKFRLNIYNEKYKLDIRPIDQSCDCYVCQHFSRAYLRHLFLAEEILAYRLASTHNLFFIVNFLRRVRQSLLDERFEKIKDEWLA
ncbi:MAG: tRNA guanosine(34) transglycosylase Tgt [Patescibacteria group bacterium]|nr:tRNA guanosine(34) transglycosylase Tgt [Patescibacteria group bacterium]